jgi:hypothetical protein
MGADKRGAPLLALTESGELTPGMTTDNLGLTISLAQAEAVYRQMIVEAGSDTTVITSGFVVSVVIKDSIVVNKQCLVEWGQWYPFNRYCPPNYSGEYNYPTGCVATAVAQLMSIFQYPSSYNGYTLNWNNMLEDSTHTDIARLMQQLGLSVNLDMQYSPTRSSSTLAYAPRTFQHFGYLHPGTYTTYNPSIAMEYIMTGQPILLSGTCTDYIYIVNPINNSLTFNSYDYVSHAWLVDGGKITSLTTHVYNLLTGEYTVLGPNVLKYIHCNFGWDNIHGTRDGMFLCDQIDTVDNINNRIISGITYRHISDNYYQYDLDMVVGISPQ